MDKSFGVFAISATVLAVVSGSASAEWVRVSVSDAGNTYVDTATIRRTGDHVTVSEMTDYKKIVTDSDFPYQSVKRQREFDCKEKRLRALSMSAYAGRMGKGDTVKSADNPSAAWESVIAGSVGDMMWKVACARRGRVI